MNWYHAPCPVPSTQGQALAQARQQQLTKPPGSLGDLELITELFASWQACEQPHLDDIAIRVFAADHGIAAQGVSAFPPEVTAQMIHNFIAGGAAISVLSRALQADFAVVNMGTIKPVTSAPGLIDISVAPGSEDFSQTAAMTEQTVERCLQAGRDQIEELDCQLFIAGDMGIGNTSSASAILAALLKLNPDQVVGRGTGVDNIALARKRALITDALELHADNFNDPLDILRCVGGLEIAAICGAYIRSAQRGIPILVDGFITTAAALLAVEINPGVRHWMIAGHQSAESAHGLALQALRLTPLLRLGMRLGEASGAAMAVPIIRSALALHRDMATFAEAGVTDGG